VQEAYSALGVSSSTRVTKEDFCSLLGGGRNLSASPGSAKKMKNNIDRYQQNNAEYQKLIAQFAQELKNQNTTPLRFFKRADANSNKVLTTEELKDASKELQIPTMNYIKLMKAFDANGNGIVEQREFVELIENATDGAGASNPPAPSNARDRGAASQPRNLGN